MPDSTTWGIHMDAHVGTDPVDNNYVAIGWTVMGDISQLPQDMQAIKKCLHHLTQMQIQVLYQHASSARDPN